MKKVIALILAAACATALAALDVQKDIIQKARQYVGCAYQMGGTKPVSFDCSGFVGYVMNPFVPGLPRVSRDMAAVGQPVKKDELSPGDLVFFATTGTPGLVSHVALYIGQDSIIHAISDGPDRGVNITSLNARYWREHFHSAKRVLQTATEKATTGKASIVFAKGSYTGELRGGEPDGRGLLVLGNGDVYEGNFARGRIEGRGVYVWKDGDRYEGEFRDNAPDGRGILTDRAGTERPVAFKRGELVKDEGDAKPKAPAKPAGSLKANRYETFLEREDSAWETWDGNVMGDYDLWKSSQEAEFKAFNERYDESSEADRFNEWKKNQ